MPCKRLWKKHQSPGEVIGPLRAYILWASTVKLRRAGLESQIHMDSVHPQPSLEQVAHMELSMVLLHCIMPLGLLIGTKTGQTRIVMSKSQFCQFFFPKKYLMVVCYSPSLEKGNSGFSNVSKGCAVRPSDFSGSCSCISIMRIASWAKHDLWWQVFFKPWSQHQ